MHQYECWSECDPPQVRPDYAEATQAPAVKTDVCIRAFLKKQYCVFRPLQKLLSNCHRHLASALLTVSPCNNLSKTCSIANQVAMSPGLWSAQCTCQHSLSQHLQSRQSLRTNRGKAHKLSNRRQLQPALKQDHDCTSKG